MLWFVFLVVVVYLIVKSCDQKQATTKYSVEKVVLDSNDGTNSSFTVYDESGNPHQETVRNGSKRWSYFMSLKNN
jgi:hypothetical protein